MNSFSKTQRDAWEREYQNPQLISLSDQPQAAVLKFLRWLKKDRKKSGDNLERPLHILDLGCGTGRNSNYLADLGHSVVGYDISPRAIEIARERAQELGISITYEVRSIADPLPLPDNSIDLVLDVTSSNSLSNPEREVYREEVLRVLRPGGYLFVRALRKTGDKHAQRLLKEFPGPGPDMYILPELGFAERVFSDEDFRAFYHNFFVPREILQTSIGYQRVDGRAFKRHYVIAYFQKPAA